MLLAKLIGPVIRKAPRREGVVDEITWRRAVGNQVATRTRPLKLEAGVLLVQDASSAWAQELSLLEGTLRARLADLGVDVLSVRFRVGTVKQPQRLPGARVDMRKRPPPAALPADVLAALERVGDDDVRAALAVAAAHNLAWQEAVLVTAAPPASPALRSAGAGSARSDRATRSPPEASPGSPAATRGSGR